MGEEQAAPAGGSRSKTPNKKGARTSRIIKMHIGRGPSRLESQSAVMYSRRR